MDSYLGTIANYRLIRATGSGSFGYVFFAKDDQDKEFAIKIFKNGISEDDLKVLENEARILQSLNHPNIVTFHEASEGELDLRKSNTYIVRYIAMEYLNGGDLMSL